MMTTETVLRILKGEGLLSDDQIREVQKREEDLKTRIQKPRPRIVSRRLERRRDGEDPSPVQVLASLHVPINETKETLSEDRIMQAVARHAGLPFLKIDPLKIDANVMTRLLPRPFATKHAVIAVSVQGDLVTLATADPFDKEVIESVSQSTGYKINPVVSTRTDILKIITEFYGFKSSVTAAEKELAPPLDLWNLEQYVKLKSPAEMEATDKHIVTAVEYMLHYAYDQRASDIHIEPKRDHSLIRFRIDGILHDVHKMPKAVHVAVASRIKMLSRMDIAEKRKPQDGRIKTEHKGKEIELRVSTLPVAFGEKVVIRIFDPEILLQDLEGLGFFPREIELFRTFISKPHGLILVTGPTGSGKTTTLYSALKTLATPEVNITTIEDPIEMIHEGFNQVGIQQQVGVTFAGSIRSILRQDPDIIMVGEIRDLDTAENAIQAALTGHLVFSTLHTNDTASSITRLLDIGVPSFLIASTLVGIVAQRLVRTICSSCQDSVPLTREDALALGIPEGKDLTISVQFGRGCMHCRGTGYFGRTAIFEVLEMTDDIRRLIYDKADGVAIKKTAQAAGMMTLREGAIKKLLQGVTTVQEVLWITGGAEQT